jgi:hypothetical protein
MISLAGVVYTVVTAKTNMAPVRVGASCRDLSISSVTGHGACSHHGGVCSWWVR